MRKIALLLGLISCATLGVYGCGSDDKAPSNDNSNHQNENGNQNNAGDNDSNQNELKGIGDACANSMECGSTYCDDSFHCANPPEDNTPKENGASCTNSDECSSGYCDPTQHCANNSDSSGAGNNGDACQNGTTCTSGYCDTNGTCADKPAISTAAIALLDIPATQVNQYGAQCDPTTFVEHCNGNELIWCESNGDGSFIVKTDLCEDDRPTCALTLQNGRNHGVCIGEADKCSAGTKDDIECDMDDAGYEIGVVYTCSQYEDGSYNFGYDGIRYCSGKCSSTKCVETTCDPAAGHACSEDSKYTLECFQKDDGRYVYMSYDCNIDGYACTILEKWATCM